MVWDGNEFYIFYNGEVVGKAEGRPLTAEDIYTAKAKLGLGTIDVIDIETGRSLQPADFPLKDMSNWCPLLKPGTSKFIF